MEYDKSTTSGPKDAIPSAPDGPHSKADNRAHLRVDSEPNADISALAEPLKFEFSGKTAMNRFLKAPMTERLCRWNDEDKGEDIVSYATKRQRSYLTDFKDSPWLPDTRIYATL